MEQLWNGCGTAVERLWNSGGTAGTAVERLWNVVERLWNGCGTIVKERMWNGGRTVVKVQQPTVAPGTAPATVSSAHPLSASIVAISTAPCVAGSLISCSSILNVGSDA